MTLHPQIYFLLNSISVPTFNVLFPGSGSINNVKFRQKNTKFDGGGEKLGFQI